MSTLDSATPVEGRPALPGEELTRRAITVITAAIVAMALAFSVINVTRLCLDLGVTAWIAWLIGPSVDLSVIGLLTGIRFLSLHGYSDEQLAKLNRFLRFCGLLTLALNTAGALWHRQFGTALGRRDRPGAADRLERDRPLAAARRSTLSAPWPRPSRRPRSGRRPGRAAARPVLIPAGLLARTRELDAEHRAATGRPISRDNLRAQLRISRDRASALVAAVRAEAAAGSRPTSLQQAA